MLSTRSRDFHSGLNDHDGFDGDDDVAYDPQDERELEHGERYTEPRWQQPRKVDKGKVSRSLSQSHKGVKKGLLAGMDDGEGEEDDDDDDDDQFVEYTTRRHDYIVPSSTAYCCCCIPVRAVKGCLFSPLVAWVATRLSALAILLTLLLTVGVAITTSPDCHCSIKDGMFALITFTLFNQLCSILF